MNIDYGKIIETANKRKETLQKLETTLASAEEILHAAEQVRAYAEELSEVYHTLDAEGKMLLPQGLREQIANLPVQYARGIVNGTLINAGAKGLLHLMHELHKA